jgi:OmpA-OmpF porin, OOP family
MMRFAMRHALALTLLLPLALIGCGSTPNAAKEVPGAAALGTNLKPQQDRITYSPVLADRQTIEALQQRLRKLNEAGVPQNNYSLAKAQCWLDTAKTQYHENDRTGYIEESMTESQKIIQALEGNKAANAGYDTPLVARSERLRDDLWGEFTKFKNNPATLACTARTVACGEVRLVRAGHAQEQTGWRAATPHVMMAEDAIRRAGQEAASCAPPPVAAAPAVAPRQATPAVAPAAPAVAAPAPAPIYIQAPAPAPIIRTITQERFALLGDTLFKFNKSGINDLLPGGVAKLKGLANHLKTYQSLSSMRITGYTDRIGSDSYNDDLSNRRAETVRAFLESQGVRSDNTQIQGLGKNEPVTECSTKAPRATQIACLQPDRRVNIDVTGIRR